MFLGQKMQPLQAVLVTQMHREPARVAVAHLIGQLRYDCFCIWKGCLKYQLLAGCKQVKGVCWLTAG